MWVKAVSNDDSELKTESRLAEYTPIESGAIRQSTPTFLATHYKREGLRRRVGARASRSHSLLICSLSVRYVPSNLCNAVSGNWGVRHDAKIPGQHGLIAEVIRSKSLHRNPACPWVQKTSSGSLLSGKYIDADYTKLSSDVFLTRAAKSIEAFTHRNIEETDLGQCIDEFSLRESTGDSAGPEIDVPPYRFGKLATDNDVPIQEASSRFKNSEHLPVSDGFIRNQIEHAIRNDCVDSLVV